jgi:hypothetical protein
VLDQVHVGAGNILGFTALEAAYNEGEEWLGQLMAYLQNNLVFLTGFIQQHLPRIKVIKPQATYMVWLDCRELCMKKEELRDFMIRGSLGLSGFYLVRRREDSGINVPVPVGLEALCSCVMPLMGFKYRQAGMPHEKKSNRFLNSNSLRTEFTFNLSCSLLLKMHKSKFPVQKILLI